LIQLIFLKFTWYISCW